MQGFEQFIRERQYLHNVSPRTVEWYKNSFRWLPCEAPTQDQLNEAVIRMREKGLKATGCNCTIRAINAYLKWAELTVKVRPLEGASIDSAHLRRCTDQEASRVEAKRSVRAAAPLAHAFPVGHGLPYQRSAQRPSPGD